MRVLNEPSKSLDFIHQNPSPFVGDAVVPRATTAKLGFDRLLDLNNETSVGKSFHGAIQLAGPQVHSPVRPFQYLIHYFEPMQVVVTEGE
jgi:hypothetical protein